MTSSDPIPPKPGALGALSLRLRMAPGRDAGAWLPFDQGDGRWIAASVMSPKGTPLAGVALRVAAGREGSSGRFDSENWARRKRWIHEAQRFESLHDAEGVGPLAACAELGAVFRPICPNCGGKLQISRDERTLQSVGLVLAAGHRELAWCPVCSGAAGAAPRFYAGTALTPEEASRPAARPFQELIDGWRQLVGKKQQFERDKVKTAETLRAEFPCWSCSLVSECHGSARTPVPAHTRLFSLHWSDLPVLLSSVPKATLLEHSRRLEESAFSRALRSNGTLDPGIAAHLLEQKLGLIRRVLELLTERPDGSAGPVLSLEAESVVMMPTHEDALGVDAAPMLLDEGGIVVQDADATPGAAPFSLPPRCDSGVPHDLAPVKFTATLSCLVVPRVVPSREGFEKFHFEGKLAIAPDASPDPKTLASQDICVLALPPGIGVSEVSVELLPKQSRIGELRFRTRDLEVRPAATRDLRSRLMKSIPDVLVRLIRLPGFEVDLRSAGRVALRILLNATPSPTGEFGIEEAALARARRERAQDPPGNVIADLRSTQEGAAVVDASRLFGPRTPKRSVDYYNRRKFPVEAWDELLGTIAGWLATPRSEATIESLRQAVHALHAIERRVRAFRLFLEPVGGWLEAIAATEEESREVEIPMEADLPLEAIARAADEARASRDGVAAARQLGQELKKVGVSARSLQLLRRKLEATTSRPITEISRGNLDDSGFYQRPAMGERHAAPEAPSPPQPVQAAPPPAARAPQPRTEPVAPPAPPPRRVDRRAAAFIPLVRRLRAGSAIDLMLRARTFGVRDDALNDWRDVLRLSVDYVHFLSESPDVGWPSPAGKESARTLLRALRHGQHLEACKAASAMIGVVRDELAEQTRLLDQGLRTWANRTAPERLREQTEQYVSSPGGNAAAEYWRFFADTHKDDARVLKNELLKLINVALLRERKPTILESLESQMAMSGSEEMPAADSLANVLQPAVALLIHRIEGSTTADAGPIAQEAASDPYKLLAWVGLSLVGVEVLDWTAKLGKNRGLDDEALVSADLLEALASERAATYGDLYDGLKDALQKHRAYLHAFADLDSTEWMGWFEQWTIPHIVADIERRVTKLRFPMTHGQERWRAFCRECDEGKYSAETVRLALGTRIVQLLSASS